MQAHDAKLFDKINALIEECRRHQSVGLVVAADQP
jgi:hypothetical protein